MALKQIQKILEEDDFICSQSPFYSKGSLPERLSVVIGPDHKQRDRLLEIHASGQLLPEAYRQPDSPPLPQRVQFLSVLPFEVKDEALNQMASLLHFVNQMIELPGFELDELNNKVVFRYVWIIHPETIDASLIRGIVGAILLNLNLLGATIEALADGTMSFNDILKQVIKFPAQKDQ